MNEPETSIPTPTQNFLDELVTDLSHITTPDAGRVATFMVIGGLLGLGVRFLYDRFGRSTADTDSVSRVFPLLTIITVGIITVIKTSLALSLGLVGALSIVRFRAAIKEPEELVYLFLCIAIGLCLGAEQVSAAILLFVAIGVFSVGNRVLGGQSRRSQVILTIQGAAATPADGSPDALSVVKSLVKRATVQRFDVDGDETQLRVILGPRRPDEAETIVRELRAKLPGCSFSYVNMDGAL